MDTPPYRQHPQPLPPGSLVVGWQGLHVAWSLILLLQRPQPCLKCHRLCLLPVDKVLVLVALHLILNGGLQVPNAFEGQL